MTQRDRFVQAALGEIGKPYSAHRDCSGFTAWAARQAGFLLPEGSVAQYTVGHGVPVRDLIAGDLVFWNTFGPSPGHVAIAINPSQVIHAINPEQGIIISNIHANMGGPMVGVRRLIFADEDAPNPKDPIDTGGTMSDVTPQSPFRELGNTTREAFRVALSRSITDRPSPMAPEADAIYDVLAEHGLTRLGAAMCWVERSNDTNPADLAYYGRDLHNAWAIKAPNGTWARYKNYAQAAADWASRILGPTYADLTTLAEFVARYAPWSDGNNSDDYGRKVTAQINAMPLLEGTHPPPQPGGPLVRFAGTAVDVPLDVPFRVMLVPPGQTNQRPGIHMTPNRYVQHETDDLRASAAGEARYLLAGAEGRQASWHFTVDDTECVQSLPLDEVAWHGGDGAGTCNYHGIACELCVNMVGDPARMAKARQNAEKVAAAAMMATNVTTIVQHSDCCAAIGNPAGCHSGCPKYIRQEGYWPTFVSHVNALRAGTTPVPLPTYATLYPPPPFDGHDKDLGSVTFVACQRIYRVTQDGLPCRQYADPKSAEVRAPLRAGNEIHGLYIVPGSDGDSWVVTQTGVRLPMRGLAPHVAVTA